MIQVVTNHIFHLLGYLLFYSFFYFSGKSFTLLLTRFFKLNEIPKTILFIKSNFIFPVIGAFAIGNILIITNFFFPLKSPAIAFIFIIWLLPNLKDIRKLDLKITLEKVVAYLVIPSLLLVSLYDTGWHYDAGFYHLNHQNWLRESNLIVGMVNIHWAFGMSSIYEYISSIFWFDDSFKYLHFLNIIFIHFFFISLLDGAKNSKEKAIKYGSILLLIFSLLDNFGVAGGRNGFIYIQGVGKQDTAVAIIFLIVSRAVFLNLKKNTFTSFDLSVTILLAFFAIQIKLSSITLAIILVYLFAVLIKNRDINFLELLKINTPSLIFSIIWICKQYLTTGCFVYPVNLTCINNFSWYLFGSTETYEAITRNSSYSLPYYDFNFIEWGKYLLSFAINRTVILNFIISNLAILIIFILFAKKQKIKFKFSVEFITFILINFLYLVNYGPTPRYTMGTFLLIVFSFGFLIDDFKFNLKSVSIYLLIIISAGSLVRGNSYNAFLESDYSSGLFDPRNEAVYVKQNNGYLKPDIGDQCWINLQCTMSIHMISFDKSSFFSTAERK